MEKLDLSFFRRLLLNLNRTAVDSDLRPLI